MNPDRPSTPAHAPQGAPPCTAAQLAQLVGLDLVPGQERRVLLHADGVTVDALVQVLHTVTETDRVEWARQGAASLRESAASLECSLCSVETAAVLASLDQGALRLSHVCLRHAVYTPRSATVLGYALYSRQQLEEARAAAAARRDGAR